MIIDEQNVARYTFSNDTRSSHQFLILLHLEHQSISFSEHLLFSFSSDFLTRFLSVLTFESSVNFQLTWFRVSGCFLCFFGCCECCTVNEPYHVPHTSRIITWRTTFTEIFFGVSKEWVRSSSHVSLITNLKTLPEKL